MAKKKKLTIQVLTDEALRADGWMTIDEFIKLLLPGLREYLQKNWSLGDDEELHHPEDLISNVSAYIDIAYHVIVDFGVNDKYVKSVHDREDD